MYSKKLYIIPPGFGKTRFIVPEIIKAAKNKGKTVYWLTDTDNIDYCELTYDAIISVSIDDWATYPFISGNVFQIVCGQSIPSQILYDLFFSISNDDNAVIIVDPAATIFGTLINPVLINRYPADGYFLFDSLEQAHTCISEGNMDKPEYREKKFIDACRREYRVYEKNRIFWMDNMGVIKIQKKRGEAPDSSTTRPLPTYQPYSIFGCTLYHFKIGSLPGMTIEEMITEINK